MAARTAACVSAVIFIITLCSNIVPTMAQSDQVIRVSYTIKEEQLDKFIGSLVSDARLDQLFPSALTRLHFAFLPQSDTYIKHFVVGETTGQLWTNGSLDRDDPSLCEPQAADCQFWLDVGIMQPPEYFRVIKVSITLQDINDNAPTFPEDTFSLSISEAVIPIVSFMIPTATDKDSSDFGIQRYELITTSSKFELQVNEEDGILDPKLLLKAKLDREMEAAYRLELVVYDHKDGGLPAKSNTMEILVTVRDANDNNPLFSQTSYSTAVAEDYPLRQGLIQVSANDPDIGLNGDIVYKFASQTENLFSETFGINNETGEIFLKKALDYESRNNFQLMVIAEDQGPDSLPAHTKVTVLVEDVNDHAPQITVGPIAGGSVSVPENRDPGFVVAHISVEDQDQGPSGQVFCELDSNYFMLESVYENSLYRIISAEVFDRELTSELTLILRCQDKGQPPMQSNEEITVLISDENDNFPVFGQTVYYARIQENGTVPFPFLTVNATDDDSGPNGKVQYQVHHDAQNLLRVDSKTGVVSTNAVFDHERMTEFEFHVVAVDTGDMPNSATVLVILTIDDINDEAPEFSKTSYNFGTFENQGSEVEIGTIKATDRDLPPFNAFVYSLAHQGNIQETFEIGESTGRITTRTVLDREYHDIYNLVVVATNTEYPHLSSSVVVTVQVADKNDNAPMMMFPNLLNNTLQVSSDTPRGYIFTEVNATDADIAENGRLIYLIAKGDEDGLFDIDPLNGGISANIDLRDAPHREYELLIMVKDQGSPQKAAVNSLFLTINTTLTFVWPIDNGLDGEGGPYPSGNVDTEDGSSSGLSFHQEIIIILACVTTVLVTILVAAIFWVRYKQRQRVKETYKYMCRVDMAQRMPVGQVGDMSDQGDSDASKESCEIRLHKPAPEPSLNTSYPLIQPQKTHLTLEDLQKAQWSRQGSLQSQRSAPQPSQLGHAQQPTRGATGLPHHLAGRSKMEVQQLLQLLKRDNDAESMSGSSAEMSNTDSGRGPSEEGGDHPRHPSSRTAAPVNRTPDGQEGEPSHTEKGRGAPPPRPPRAASLRHQGSRTPGVVAGKPPIAPPSGQWMPQPSHNAHGHQGQAGEPQGHQCHNPEGLCQCQGHPDTSTANQNLHPAYYHPTHSLGSSSGLPKSGRGLHPHMSTFGHPKPVDEVSNITDNEDVSDDGGSSTSGSFVVELQDNIDMRAVDV